MRYNPLEEPIVLHETVFEDDFLGRQTFGKTLSAVLEQIEDPLVFALDGPWGSGKSHFLQRWVGAHTKQNGGTARTVYFDAFAYDYMTDPLVALISSIRDQLPKPERGRLKPIMAAAYKLRKPLLRVAAAAATAGASEALSPIGDAAAEALGKEGTNYLDQFWSEAQGRHAAMDELRNALIELSKAANEGEKLRLIIVIDELDRCRPDFALQILEIIKHFFSVDGIHFVLGLNSIALENSVRAKYGSDLDAESYLKKFISRWVSLPNSLKNSERSKLTRVFAVEKGREMNIPANLLRPAVSVLKCFESNPLLSIRDIKKYLSDLSLIPESKYQRTEDEYVYVAATILLVSNFNRKLAEQLVNSTADIYSIIEAIGENVEDKLWERREDETNRNYCHDTNLVVTIWWYILSDRSKLIFPEWKPYGDISRIFWGAGRDIRSIPQMILDDWLSLTELPQNRAAE